MQRSISAASSDKYVDIVGSFQTGYHISGIAPFGDLLVMLAYIPEEDDKDKKISTSAPLRQVTTTACPHITLSLVDVSVMFGKFCREQHSVQKYILYHGKMMWLLPMLFLFMVMSTIRQRITHLPMLLSQV